MLLLLLVVVVVVVYLIDNADLLLLRFSKDTLDVADIFSFSFIVKMAGMYLGTCRSSIFGKGR